MAVARCNLLDCIVRNQRTMARHREGEVELLLLTTFLAIESLPAAPDEVAIVVPGRAKPVIVRIPAMRGVPVVAVELDSQFGRVNVIPLSGTPAIAGLAAYYLCFRGTDCKT